jgi:hypothetical protein
LHAKRMKEEEKQVKERERQLNSIASVSKRQPGARRKFGL